VSFGVEGRLSINAGDFVSQINDAVSALEDLKQSSRGIARDISEVGDSIFSVGRDAVNAAQNFREIERPLDKITATTAGVSSGFEEMGNTINVAAKTSAERMEDFDKAAHDAVDGVADAAKGIDSAVRDMTDTIDVGVGEAAGRWTEFGEASQNAVDATSSGVNEMNSILGELEGTVTDATGAATEGFTELGSTVESSMGVTTQSITEFTGEASTMGIEVQGAVQDVSTAFEEVSATTTSALQEMETELTTATDSVYSFNEAITSVQTPAGNFQIIGQGAADSIKDVSMNADDASANVESFGSSMGDMTSAGAGLATTVGGLVFSFTRLERAQLRAEKATTMAERSNFMLGQAEQKLQEMQTSGLATQDQIADQTTKVAILRDRAAQATENARLQEERLTENQFYLAATLGATVVQAVGQTQALKGLALGAVAAAKNAGGLTGIMGKLGGVFGKMGGGIKGAVVGLGAMASASMASSAGVGALGASLLWLVGIPLAGAIAAMVAMKYHVFGVREIFFGWTDGIEKASDAIDDLIPQLKPLTEGMALAGNTDLIISFWEAVGGKIAAGVPIQEALAQAAKESGGQLQGAGQAAEGYAIAVDGSLQPVSQLTQYNAQLGAQSEKNLEVNKQLGESQQISGERAYQAAQYYLGTQKAVKDLSQEEFNLVASEYGLQVAMFANSEVVHKLAEEIKAKQGVEEQAAKTTQDHIDKVSKEAAAVGIVKEVTAENVVQIEQEIKARTEQAALIEKLNPLLQTFAHTAEENVNINKIAIGYYLQQNQAFDETAVRLSAMQAGYKTWNDALAQTYGSIVQNATALGYFGDTSQAAAGQMVEFTVRTEEQNKANDEAVQSYFALDDAQQAELSTLGVTDQLMGQVALHRANLTKTQRDGIKATSESVDATEEDIDAMVKLLDAHIDLGDMSALTSNEIQNLAASIKTEGDVQKTTTQEVEKHAEAMAALSGPIREVAKEWGIYSNTAFAATDAGKRLMGGLQDMQKDYDTAVESARELAIANGVDLRTALTMTDDELLNFIGTAENLGPTLEQQAEMAKKAAEDFRDSWMDAFDKVNTQMDAWGSTMSSAMQTVGEEFKKKLKGIGSDSKEEFSKGFEFNNEFWDKAFPEGLARQAFEENIDIPELIGDTEKFLKKAVKKGLITKEDMQEGFSPFLNFMEHELPNDSEKAFAYLVERAPRWMEKLKPALVNGFISVGAATKGAVKTNIVDPFIEAMKGLESGASGLDLGRSLVGRIQAALPAIRAQSGPLADTFESILTDTELGVDEKTQRIIEILGQISPAWQEQILGMDKDADGIQDIVDDKILGPVDTMKLGILEAFEVIARASGNTQWADNIAAAIRNITNATSDADKPIENLGHDFADLQGYMDPLTRTLFPLMNSHEKQMAIDAAEAARAVNSQNTALGGLSSTLSTVTTKLGEFKTAGGGGVQGQATAAIDLSHPPTTATTPGAAAPGTTVPTPPDFTAHETAWNEYKTFIDGKVNEIGQILIRMTQGYTLMGTAIQTAFDYITNTIWAGHATAVNTQVNAVGQGLIKMVQGYTLMSNSIGQALGGIVTTWGGHVAAVGGQVNAVGGQLIKMVSGYGLMGSAAGQALGGIVVAWGGHVSAVGSAVNRTGQQLLKLAKGYALLADAGAKAMSNLASATASSMSRIRSSMSQAERAARSLQSAISALKSKDITVTTHYKTTGSKAGGGGGAGAGGSARAQHGFEGVVSQPTRFFVGEGNKPEHVQITPLSGSSNWKMTGSAVNNSLSVRAGRGTKKSVQYTEYYDNGKKITVYSDGSKKKSHYKIHKGEDWRSAVARDSGEPYERNLEGRGDYVTPGGTRYKSEDMYAFNKAKEDEIIKKKEEKENKTGKEEKATTTTYTYVNKKGKVKKKEVEIDAETGAAHKGKIETRIGGGRVSPNLNVPAATMGRFGMGGIWQHAAYGGPGDMFPFPIPEGFKKTLFKTYYPDGSVWNNYSDGSKEMIRPPRNDKKKKRKKGQHGFSGVVRNPTEFMAGEGGRPELVNIEPFKGLTDSIADTVNKEVSRIVKNVTTGTGGSGFHAGGNGGGGNREVTLVIKQDQPIIIDGRAIGRVIKEYGLKGISAIT
jgi:hypothetical protein